MTGPRSREPAFFEDGRNKYRNVLNGKITPEQYITSRRDNASRNTQQCPELYLLRLNYSLYRKFLLCFPPEQRRLILLKYEVIGFRHSELYNYYGIHSDLIGRFIGNKNTDKHTYKAAVKIRKIKTTDEYSKEFLAFIAILCRVPTEWLLVDRPKMNWDIGHFYDLHEGAFFKTGEDFVDYLFKLDNSYHDVQGVVVNHADTQFFIRLENWFGSFTIEMFNPLSPAREYLLLKNLLSPFKPTEGFMPTVVDSQLNYVFLCKKELGKPICLPIEIVHR